MSAASIFLVCFSVFASVAAAAEPVATITPIYDELIRLSFPAGFKQVYENDSGTFFIQESAPAGETVEKWSQLLTLTGSKGLASNPVVNLQRVIQRISSGFQRACPATFATKNIGRVNIGGHDAFISLIGCGEVKNGPPRSETAMIIAIKGTADYYSVQWALRGAPLQQAPKLVEQEWLARYKRLQPIKFCPRVPGEQAPYPSCVDKKG